MSDLLISITISMKIIYDHKVNKFFFHVKLLRGRLACRPIHHWAGGETILNY